MQFAHTMMKTRFLQPRDIRVNIPKYIRDEVTLAKEALESKHGDTDASLPA